MQKKAVLTKQAAELRKTVTDAVQPQLQAQVPAGMPAGTVAVVDYLAEEVLLDFDVGIHPR